MMTQVGTPMYAAPEIFTGADYDESVDIYSMPLGSKVSHSDN